MDRVLRTGLSDLGRGGNRPRVRVR
jgi:hypothetical protein